MNDWECKDGIINYGQMEPLIFFDSFSICNLKMFQVGGARPHFNGCDLQFVSQDRLWYMKKGLGSWFGWFWRWVDTYRTKFWKDDHPRMPVISVSQKRVSTCTCAIQSINKWRRPKLGPPQYLDCYGESNPDIFGLFAFGFRQLLSVYTTLYDYHDPVRVQLCNVHLDDLSQVDAQNLMTLVSMNMTVLVDMEKKNMVEDGF